MNFPGPLGTKRRRMRSGGNVSTVSNKKKNDNDDDAPQMDNDEVGDIAAEKVTQTSKCKGATTIPIFLKSKSKMANRMNNEQEPTEKKTAHQVG